MNVLTDLNIMMLIMQYIITGGVSLKLMSFSTKFYRYKRLAKCVAIAFWPIIWFTLLYKSIFKKSIRAPFNIYAYKENNQIVIEIPITQFENTQLFKNWNECTEFEHSLINELPKSMVFAQYVIDRMNEPSKSYVQGEINPGECLMMLLLHDMKDNPPTQ